MSSFPKVDLSAQYTYVSAAMAEGLEKIMEQNYEITPNRIPPAVLHEAQELFDYSIGQIDGLSATPKQVTAWMMVLDHLRAINPQKYKRDTKRRVISQDVRNLASLLQNLARDLSKVPEDQRKYIPILQKFFKRLSNTGEEVRYEHHMGGKYNGKYSYEL